GYDVTYRFSETYSGLTLDRPKLNELRELIRSEQTDSVVIYCLDRLSRDPTQGVILFQELEKHNVALEAVMETVDGSELGKLISYIRGFASKLEAEKIKERTLRGKRERVKEGKIPHGGYARLYGYNYDKVTKRRIVNETEASWVKRMFEWLVDEGLTTNAITYRLRELKAPTKLSQHWNRSSVLEILRNQSYTGKTYAFTFHQGTNRRKPEEEWMEIPDATPALISNEFFKAAQQQLKLNQGKAKRNTKQQYLLRGHLYCQQCGKAYCGHMDRVIRYYRCPGKNRITSPVNPCTNRNWRGDKLEALVWNKIEAVLADPEVIITTINKQRDEANNHGALESELKQVDRKLKALNREQVQLLQWALKGFPEETVEAENKRINGIRNNLESRKAELESQIKASRDASVSVPKLEAYIQLVRNHLTSLDFDVKRFALDMLNIKVWIDGPSVEITGIIPIEESVVVTKSS
ncbi:recombinase family protein, partial [Chloroflexota bacterium]